MMRTLKIRAAAAAALLASFGVAQAAPVALQGRDINGNAVAANDTSAVFEYDANLGLTWLRDWNYAGTAMTWSEAMTWASTLKVGAFAGWALPTIDAGDTSCSENFNPGGGYPTQYFGYNCTGSAMGYLYYTELSNLAGGPLPGTGPLHTGPFQQVQSTSYWSGTEYAPLPGIAWSFRTTVGSQTNDNKRRALYAVAVRPGDVAASVPEPQTWAMMLLGLGAVLLARRKRTR
jgi:hypothetical protein